MATKINKLTHLKIASLTEPKWHADGLRLYLRVQARGAKSWIYVYQWNKKRKELALGPASVLGLAEARKKARRCNDLLDAGIDPSKARAEAVQAAANALTFGEVSDQYISEHEEGWKNAKHVAQWKMTMSVYAKPLRSMLVADITPDDVVACLSPIWKKKPETASRTQNRIAKVLGAAKARGLRKGDNPAVWAENLEFRMDRRDRLSRGHHAAMALSDVAPFLRRLRALKGPSTKALEFTILTAARTGEALGATWGEINLDAAVWTIPASRMKMKRGHTVPLSDAALAVLRLAKGELDPAPDAFVFPGEKRGHGLCNMAMENVLRRMKAKPATVHGFRSCFKGWAGTISPYPRELAEEALAHLVGNETEQAYNHLPAVEKRRLMMQDWAEFCARGEVVPFKKRGATA